MENLTYLEFKSLLLKKSSLLNDEFDLKNWECQFNESLKLYSNVLEDLNKDLVYFNREYGLLEYDNLFNQLKTMSVEEEDKFKLENLIKKVKVFLLFLNN